MLQVPYKKLVSICTTNYEVGKLATASQNRNRRLINLCSRILSAMYLLMSWPRVTRNTNCLRGRRATQSSGPCPKLVDYSENTRASKSNYSFEIPKLPLTMEIPNGLGFCNLVSLLGYILRFDTFRNRNITSIYFSSSFRFQFYDTVISLSRHIPGDVLYLIFFCCVSFLLWFEKFVCIWCFHSVGNFSFFFFKFFVEIFAV